MAARMSAAIAVAALAAVALSASAGAGPNGSENGTMCVLNTQLRPENEVPTSTSTASGHAQIKVRNDGTIEYKVFIHNPGEETFFGGHVHQAPAGSPGPIVVPLFGGSTSEKNFHQHGELTPVDNPATARDESMIGTDICNNPAGYYVNYHTLTNRPGAIRGQLG